MSYEIIIKSEFSAAHKVRLHKGAQESLHGHNWFVEARIGGKKLNNDGIMLDFITARDLLKNVLAELDHHNLNEAEVLNGENPTAERIARYIFENFEKVIKAHSVKLISITVWETPSCAAIYSGNRRT